MYSKILVPTDGSDASRTAIEHAVDLAVKYDAEIHGLYVTEIGRLEGMSLDIGAAMERLEADEEAGIDLVVMGTHGHGGLGRRLLGSVTESVVRLCDVPVHTVHAEA
jgi:nucleotide-binding universal stress UspA family protein